MTQYIFQSTLSRDNTITFLSGLANYQNAGYVSGRTIITNFNHTTQQQKDDFCDLLAEKGITLIAIDGVETNLLKKFRYFAGDTPIVTHIYNTTLTGMSSTYANAFPIAVKNLRIPIDTNYYKYIGYQVTWNKNGGAGVHDLKVVDQQDETKTLFELTNMATDQHENFVKNATTDLTQIAAGYFNNFLGFLKIMVRSSVPANTPILIAFNLFLRR